MTAHAGSRLYLPIQYLAPGVMAPSIRRSRTVMGGRNRLHTPGSQRAHSVPAR
jgi:hypothetical protein